MSLFLVPILIVLAATAAWLLRRALTGGETQTRFSGTVSRASVPLRHWATIAINAIALVAFGSVALIMIYQAIAGLSARDRASDHYPSRALAQRAEGQVMLHCIVTPSWGVKDCAVTEETPKGLGFGASALQISGFWKLPEKDRGRLRPGADVNVPIRFKLPDDGR